MHTLGASVLQVKHKLDVQDTHLCVVVDFVVRVGHVVTQVDKLKND